MNAVTTRQADATFLISCILAMSIPFFIDGFWLVYYVDPDLAVIALRPTLLSLSTLLVLLHHRAHVTAGERRLAVILGLLCCTLLAPSLTATDPVRALSDWTKFALLCGLSLLWCRSLRDPLVGRLFGRSLLFSAVMIMALILIAYLHYMGFTIPTYKSSREFKGVVERVLPLNAVSFACVYSYVLGMMFARPGKSLWALGAVLVFVSTVFTGSRTPVAILFVSGLLIILFRATKSRQLLFRVSGWIVLLASLAGAVAILNHLPFKEISRISEGRWDLWSVALQKFQERPIFGFGFESWRDDLVSRLPGEYALTLQLAKNIAGGYHNEYLTILAEQGLAGFIAIMSFFAYLFRSSWKLAFHPWRTWQHGAWALFGCTFLFARAGVEMPGLFGYGQEPADYLAFMFVAVVASRFSIEEDNNRRQQRQVVSNLRLAA